MNAEKQNPPYVVSFQGNEKRVTLPPVEVMDLQLVLVREFPVERYTFHVYTTRTATLGVYRIIIGREITPRPSDDE